MRVKHRNSTIDHKVFFRLGGPEAHFNRDVYTCPDEAHRLTIAFFGLILWRMGKGLLKKSDKRNFGVIVQEQSENWQCLEPVIAESY